jgi:hypothetical protein
VVSSGGVLPVGIAVHGSLVYVANAGPADSNYSGFRLGFLGNLSPLPGSTQVSATGGVGAVDPGISPDGRYLYVNESRIDAVGVFAVSPDGNLTEFPGSPAPLPARATPAGIAVS